MSARRAALAIAVALALGACASTTHREAIPVGSPYAADQLPLGSWRVTGYRFVGVSAMSRADADAWIGRAADFSRDAAGFASDPCRAPRYAQRAVATADLASEFRVRPGDLGLPGAMVQEIDVRCDAPWSAPGNRLLALGANRLVLVWDGVFFDLSRR